MAGDHSQRLPRAVGGRQDEHAVSELPRPTLFSLDSAERAVVREHDLAALPSADDRVRAPEDLPFADEAGDPFMGIGHVVPSALGADVGVKVVFGAVVVFVNILIYVYIFKIRKTQQEKKLTII